MTSLWPAQGGEPEEKGASLWPKKEKPKGASLWPAPDSKAIPKPAAYNPADPSPWLQGNYDRLMNAVTGKADPRLALIEEARKDFGDKAESYVSSWLDAPPMPEEERYKPMGEFLKAAAKYTPHWNRVFGKDLAGTIQDHQKFLEDEAKPKPMGYWEGVKADAEVFADWDSEKAKAEHVANMAQTLDDSKLPFERGLSGSAPMYLLSKAGQFLHLVFGKPVSGLGNLASYGLESVGVGKRDDVAGPTGDIFFKELVFDQTGIGDALGMTEDERMVFGLVGEIAFSPGSPWGKNITALGRGVQNAKTAEGLVKNFAKFATPKQAGEIQRMLGQAARGEKSFDKLRKTWLNAVDKMNLRHPVKLSFKRAIRDLGEFTTEHVGVHLSDTIASGQWKWGITPGRMVAETPASKMFAGAVDKTLAHFGIKGYGQALIKKIGDKATLTLLNDKALEPVLRLAQKTIPFSRLISKTGWRLLDKMNPAAQVHNPDLFTVDAVGDAFMAELGKANSEVTKAFMKATGPGGSASTTLDEFLYGVFGDGAATYKANWKNMSAQERFKAIRDALHKENPTLPGRGKGRRWRTRVEADLWYTQRMRADNKALRKIEDQIEEVKDQILSTRLRGKDPTPQMQARLEALLEKENAIRHHPDWEDFWEDNPFMREDFDHPPTRDTFEIADPKPSELRRDDPNLEVVGKRTRLVNQKKELIGESSHEYHHTFSAPRVRSFLNEAMARASKKPTIATDWAKNILDIRGQVHKDRIAVNLDHGVEYGILSGIRRRLVPRSHLLEFDELMAQLENSGAEHAMETIRAFKPFYKRFMRLPANARKAVQDALELDLSSVMVNGKFKYSPDVLRDIASARKKAGEFFQRLEHDDRLQKLMTSPATKRFDDNRWLTESPDLQKMEGEIMDKILREKWAARNGIPDQDIYNADVRNRWLREKRAFKEEFEEYVIDAAKESRELIMRHANEVVEEFIGGVRLKILDGGGPKAHEAFKKLQEFQARLAREEIAMGKRFAPGEVFNSQASVGAKRYLITKYGGEDGLLEEIFRLGTKDHPALTTEQINEMFRTGDVAPKLLKEMAGDPATMRVLWGTDPRIAALLEENPALTAMGRAMNNIRTITGYKKVKKALDTFGHQVDLRGADIINLRTQIARALANEADGVVVAATGGDKLKRFPNTRAVLDYQKQHKGTKFYVLDRRIAETLDYGESALANMRAEASAWIKAKMPGSARVTDVVDDIHKHFKKFVLVSGAYHARNLTQGIGQMLLGGVTWDDVVLSTRMDANAVIHTNAGPVTVADLWADFKGGSSKQSFVGAFNPPDATSGGMTGLRRALKRDPIEWGADALPELNRAMADFVETRMRFPLYIRARKLGMTNAQAHRHVNHYMFDYTSKTPWQRNVLGRLAPFMSWSQENMRFWVSTLINNPGDIMRYMPLMKAHNRLAVAALRKAGDYGTDDPPPLELLGPRYALGSFQVLGYNAQTGLMKYVDTGPHTPIHEIPHLATREGLLGHMSPIPGLALSGLFDVNIKYPGQPVTRPADKVNVGPLKMNRWQYDVFRTLAPGGRLAAELTDETRTLNERIARQLGYTIQTVHIDTAMRIERRRIISEALEIREGIRKRGYRDGLMRLPIHNLPVDERFGDELARIKEILKRAKVHSERLDRLYNAWKGK